MLALVCMLQNYANQHNPEQQLSSLSMPGECWSSWHGMQQLNHQCCWQQTNTCRHTSTVTPGQIAIVYAKQANTHSKLTTLYGGNVQSDGALAEGTLAWSPPLKAVGTPPPAPV